MNRKTIGAAAALVLVALGAIAAIASAAPGTSVGVRRLTGPFCIDARTGVVRSVAATRKCRAGELRKYGVAVNGPSGPAGAPGTNGQDGTAGPRGPQGLEGPKGETGLQG
ncbi:MAG TPA: hypothetical protein VH538_08710, partial [Gaiellaceae bacterium]